MNGHRELLPIFDGVFDPKRCTSIEEEVDFCIYYYDSPKACPRTCVFAVKEDQKKLWAKYEAKKD